MEGSIEKRPVKLYSKKSIGVATFLGGPLAACLMMRRNFLNLGDEKSGLITIFIGGLATMGILIAAILIPDNAFGKSYSFIVPAIYTGIIMLVLENSQGKALKLQQELVDGFYSGWRAAGVGLLSALILIGSLVAYVFLGPVDPTVEAYDEMLTEFSQNEEQAMKLYDLLQSEEYNKVPDFVVTEGIPIWQENLSLLKSFGYIQGVPEELTSNVKLLNKYCFLRIQSYDLIRKIILEDTNAYDSQLDKINEEIDFVLTELN